MGLYIAQLDNNNKEIGGFRIGYAGFYHLRMAIGRALGFEVKSGETSDIGFDYIDTSNSDDKLLNDFFNHSDCDGRFDQKHIKHLNYIFNTIGKVQNERFAYFKDFVAKSAIEKSKWEFV